MGIISIKTCTECGDVLSTANDKPICIDCQVDAVYKYHNIRQAIDIKYIEIAGDYL
jgi:ABC-type ATPase with predicted acetyltransferase domain